MKSREELRNDYEEALFAIIMDDIIELDGEALLAERERLMQSDEAKVPDDVNERCIAFIKDLFDKREKECKSVRKRKIWRTIMIAAVIFCLCFSTAYASIPVVKNVTDSLLISINNVSAKLFYGNSIPDVHSKYAFWRIPDGFSLVEEGLEDNVEWCLYSDSKSTIMISVNYDYKSENTMFSVDVEDAEEVDSIHKRNYEGLIVKKGDRVHLAVSDNERNNFIQIIANGIEESVVMSIFDSIKYVG